MTASLLLYLLRGVTGGTDHKRTRQVSFRGGGGGAEVSCLHVNHDK